MLIVRIYRLENGVLQNRGTGFFVDENRILSAFHIYSHLERQDHSTYIAVFDNQCFQITPIQKNCTKDLVLYQCNGLVCPNKSIISATEPSLGDKVLIKSFDKEIVTSIFSKDHLTTTTIQHNYTCLLDTNIFCTVNSADEGMSGSIVLNTSLEIIGLYSGNSKLDGINNDEIYGVCIDLSEIVTFINELN